MSLRCAYCETNPAGNSDHVFPKSLGGEDIYMDCVCDKCNNDFSRNERELFQKSIIALMKSFSGLEGYTKNKLRPAPLKYPEIFYTDNENKIIYEAGLHNGLKPYMRPQFIKVSERIYSEGPSREEIKLLINAFNEWRSNNLILVTKFPSKKGECYKAVRFILKDGKYVTEEIELKKVKKEAIHYLLMKTNDNIKDYFLPRMFIDDSEDLLIRSREVEEGIQFVIDLLNYCNQDAPRFSSYSEKNAGNEIQLSIKFDIEKMQQALVKIGLNALMHYHPETKYDQLLKPAKDYALGGKPIRAAIDTKIDSLDTRHGMHTVLFCQLPVGLMVRVSLFGGSFPYSFLIEGLNLFSDPENVSGLEVDFKKAKQKYYPMAEYIQNRSNDMGNQSRGFSG